MKMFAFVAGACALSGSAALAQVDGQFEFRIRSEDGIAAGGSTTLTAMTFWLEARYTEALSTNFGVSLFDNGAALSSISMTDSLNGSSIGRASTGTGSDFFGTDYTQFGRGTNFRFTEPGNQGVDLVNGTDSTGVDESTQDDTAFTNASWQNLLFRSTLDNGYIQGDSIVGISAYDTRGVGPLPAAQWGAPVPAGQFSAWAQLYRFQITIDDTSADRTINLNAQGNLQAISALGIVGSNRSPVYSLLTPSSTSLSFSFVPTPGAAALLGLGALAAGRRRR